MSVSFGLSNFKGFKELESVELKPLTVICGTNNSGKSSLIQSLLLMKQSNVENTKIPLNTYIQEPLIFNGLYTRLGSYLDVVHAHSSEEEIVLRWELKKQEIVDEFYPYTVDSEITVKIKSTETKRKENQTVVSYFRFKEFTTNYSLEFLRLDNEKYRIIIRNDDVISIIRNWIYSYVEYFNNEFFRLFHKLNTYKVFQELIIEEVIFTDNQVKFDGIFPVVISYSDNFQEQILNLIDIIKKNMPSSAEEEMSKYLCELIDIIYKQFSPDIINQIISNYDNNPLMSDWGNKKEEKVEIIQKEHKHETDS